MFLLYVMLNSFQHLMESISYETLKQVQGDKTSLFRDLRLKEEKLKELGIVTLRFYDEEVMENIDNVLRAIQCFIEDFEERHKTHTL